jgi:tRNA(Ile)-lysidine synthase TilS/MesJ
VNKPVILCMFSGGVDSTGALFRLLTHPDYRNFRIQVHHIHLLNIERRALAEKQACQRILQVFKDMGLAFDYSENTLEANFLTPPEYTRFMFDSDVTYFMAGNICEGKRAIQYIAMGRTKSDTWQPNGALNRDLLLRLKRSEHIFHAVMSLTPPEKRPVFIRPVEQFTKAEVWNMLPAEARQHIWWCRHPVWLDNGKQFSTCNKCPTCVAMREILGAEAPPEVGVSQPDSVSG